MVDHDDRGADDEARRLRHENALLTRRLARADARARERQGQHLDLLERAVNASALAIFDWIDVARDEIYVTKPVYEVLGFEPYSFVASWSALAASVSPAQRPDFERAVARALYRHEPMRAEVEMRHADGHYRWMEVTALATASVDGEVTRFTGSLRDIDDHHRLRCRMAALSQQLSLVIRGAGAGVWDWPDVTTTDVHFSEGLLRLIGLDPARESMTLDLFWTLIEEADHAAVQAAIAGAVERGEPFDVEYRLRFRGRGLRWVRSMGTAVRDGRGRVVRLVGAITDIHDRREDRARLARQLAQQRALNYLMATDLIEPVWHIGAFVDVIREDHAAELTPGIGAHLDTIVERVGRTEAVVRAMLASVREA